MEGESLSLAETNKVRVSLGLAPLTDDAATLDDDNNQGGSGDEATEPDADELAEENWSKRQAEEKQARQDKETKERLAKAKNQRELRAKLQGKGLGEADTVDTSSTAGEASGKDGGSASDWIKKSRKAAKARAAELEKLRKREQELEDRDREAVYGEEDLAGLRVGHEAGDFEEGKDVILTLRDNKVLEDGDDELQNVNLAEYSRTKQKLDLQKRGKTAYKYTGFDDDEFDAFGAGKERGVLSKYDEVIGENSKDGEGFRLGGTIPTASTSRAGAASASALLAAANGAAEGSEQQKQLRRELLSLDYTKTESSDYLQEGDVGFKKPKKKKKAKAGGSSSRRIAADTFDDNDAPQDANGNGDVHMEAVEEEDIKPKIPTAERRLAKEGGGDDGGIIDDDEMQAALARQRRAANKKRTKGMRGEDLARQSMDESLRAASTQTEETNGNASSQVKQEDEDGFGGLETRLEPEQEDDERDGGLVLDDTSEFIRNISSRPIIAKRDQPNRTNGTATPQHGVASSSRLPQVKSEPREDSDVPLDEMDVKEEEPEEGEAFEGEDDDASMQLDREASTFSDGGLKPPGARDSRSRSAEADTKKEEDESTGFGFSSSEKLVSGGLASTLSLLRQSGLVKPLTPEELAREKSSKERERFVMEQRMMEAERELERARNKASSQNKDQATREYENKQRAFRDAQRSMEAFKNYKPNVEISYTDEFGRNLTPKEAWKDLSHKFHGKGSGTGKREKLLKKIEDERKREAMASGDSPLNTDAAFKARQQRTGSATMILGVGNRNAAPGADALLGSSAGRGNLNVAKNKPGQGGSSGGAANKRKREPKVLG